MPDYKTFAVHIDLTKKELRNAVLQPLSTAPSSPVVGQMYYDTNVGVLQPFWWTGSSWTSWSSAFGNVNKASNASATNVLQVSAGADKTIQDYISAGGIIKVNATGVVSIAVSSTDYAPATSGTTALKGNGSGGFAAATLNDVGAPTSSFSMNSQKITNLADPTTAQDAVTKAYADALIATGNNKGTVRVASTANVTISNPGTAIFDGVTLSNGDLILLKDQTAGAENGLYVFNGSGSALTRTTNADTSAEVKAGLFVFVSEGTVNGDNGYTLTTNDPITVGTTPLVFTQTSGAGQITAGAGLTKTGNQLDVGAGTGIVVNTDTITLDRSTNGAIVPFKYTTTIGNGSATSFVVTHNLNTKDVFVSVRAVADDTIPVIDYVATTVNTVTIYFASAPASNSYVAVVIG